MNASGPLNGITVLDMTKVLAGPFCTMILRDLGAKIIKIEPPEGDEARNFGPFLPVETTENRKISAYFTSLNCGKRSVVLDLKKSSGRKTLVKLISQSDVLVENFKPGTLAKLGFPEDRLNQINPRLIYAAISGFGATGPFSQRPAYDMIIQALSGLMSITGPDPEQSANKTTDSTQSVRVGTSISDIVTGLYAAIGIVSSLYRRTESDVGTTIDLGMLDSTISVLENAITRYQVTGRVPGPLGSRHPSITPFEIFPTADENIAIAAGNDRLFKSLCTVIGMPELISDPHFTTNARRNKNCTLLRIRLEKILTKKPIQFWLQRLPNAGIPAARVNTVADLFRDPQVAARKMLVPVAGTNGLLIPGAPLKFLGVKVESQKPSAPSLGEHTAETLFDLEAIDK